MYEVFYIVQKDRRARILIIPYLFSVIINCLQRINSPCYMIMVFLDWKARSENNILFFNTLFKTWAVFDFNLQPTSASHLANTIIMGFLCQHASPFLSS